MTTKAEEENELADTDLDDIPWLQDWYANHCNGTWEHRYGISIESLDNPGWRIRIDLVGTEFESRPFREVILNADPADGDLSARWHVCKVEDGRFEGAGGAHDLQTIVGIFRSWAT